MRISDWSSDVCSSDLLSLLRQQTTMAAMRQSGESTSPDSLVEAEAIANGPSTPARAPTVDHARLVEPQRGLEPSLRHQFGDPARRQASPVAPIGPPPAFACVGLQAGPGPRPRPPAPPR